MSKTEQSFRHEIENKRVKIISGSEGRNYRINIWGMFFAFLALIVIMGVTVYALFLDRQWIVAIFGLTSIGTIIGLFIKPNNK